MSSIINNLKPFKVLLVSGVQMKDDTVITQAKDFGDIAGLLKLWCIPFDILRLDSTEMMLNHYIDSNRKPKYSVIIWTACKAEFPWKNQNYHILTNVVKQYGISLIVVGKDLQELEIQNLLGITLLNWENLTEPIKILQPCHFITRELPIQSIPTEEVFSNQKGPRVAVSVNDVDTLAASGDWPQLITRKIPTDKGYANLVWISANKPNLFSSNPIYVNLLFRCLVWTIGYCLVKDYGKSVVLRMDDPGSAQSAYLSRWQYGQLTRKQIYDHIVTPLRKYNATLGVAFCPGYVWAPTKSIKSSINIDFFDPYGTRQNVISTYEGLLDGIKEEVIEIRSHGLTHMIPDLDTPIPESTNWWQGSPNNEWAIEGWYREFYDSRRNQEIDADTQRKRLELSADLIEKDFGIRPLVFIPGGHEISGNKFVSKDSSIKIFGAAPSAIYHAYIGHPNDSWHYLGVFRTDLTGNGQCLLPESLDKKLICNYFLSINNAGKETQFISDPISYNSEMEISLKLRDHTMMTVQEKIWFPLARESLNHGEVVIKHKSHDHQIADTYTYKIAADVGYGLALDAYVHYLNKDRVISMRMVDINNKLQTSFDMRVPGVLLFHDRDISLYDNWLFEQLDFIKRMWPDVYYLRTDEWMGYLHSQNEAEVLPDGSLQFHFYYPEKYCRYLKEHASTWTLALSDDLQKEIQAKQSYHIIVDDSILQTADTSEINEKMELSIPAGRGKHTVTFRFLK
jgi:hypothetical protein